jgi:hypothetical protein
MEFLLTTAAPKIKETMVLDTKVRRDMLQQAAAMGERSQFSPGRMKMPTLVVLSGRVNQKEFLLANKLTVIGKSPMATVRLRGWFKPKNGGTNQSARRRVLFGHRRPRSCGQRHTDFRNRSPERWRPDRSLWRSP